MDNGTRQMLVGALVPIVIGIHLYLSKKLEQRIRRMPPSTLRRILLFGRR